MSHAVSQAGAARNFHTTQAKVRLRAYLPAAVSDESRAEQPTRQFTGLHIPPHAQRRKTIKMACSSPWLQAKPADLASSQQLNAEAESVLTGKLCQRRACLAAESSPSVLSPLPLDTRRQRYAGWFLPRAQCARSHSRSQDTSCERRSRGRAVSGVRLY